MIENKDTKYNWSNITLVDLEESNKVLCNMVSKIKGLSGDPLLEVKRKDKALMERLTKSATEED